MEVIFREPISRIWFWRNHHLLDDDSPLPSTFDLARKILYIVQNILIDVYNVSVVIYRLRITIRAVNGTGFTRIYAVCTLL